MKAFIKRLVLSSSFLKRIAVFFRRKYLKRKFDIKYGSKVFIGFSTVCEGKNGFAENSSMVSSSIGYGSYIAESTKISKTKIGRFCSIGPNVKCIFGKHPSSVFVSTHPAFFSLRTPVGFTYADKQYFEEFAESRDEDDKYSIIIGNDVWIGANVSLMDGIEIGDGAIVAANSLVNKDVSPYTVVGGVPAKIIKKRFSDEEIQFLLRLKWWNKSKKWISEHATYFKNIKDLQKKLVNE